MFECVFVLLCVFFSGLVCVFVRFCVYLILFECV